uniref:Uncharacterized protein n=1 Tax=Rhizophora mucronata TaxID=61149 RepID=A0A2P2LK95_RHIMU
MTNPWPVVTVGRTRDRAFHMKFRRQTKFQRRNPNLNLFLIMIFFN